MTFFAQNSSYFVASGAVGTFSSPTTTGAATVGFLATTGTGTFMNQPTANLCPGKSYVVIVGTGSTGTINTALAIGVPGSTGTNSGQGATGSYPLVSIPTNMSTTNLALFTPTSSNTTMNLGTAFNATLGTVSGSYLLNSSPNGQSVGYTGGATITSPLNACPGCPCATGTTCGTGGICSGTSPCTVNSPCAGTCQGICSGSNMQCVQQSNGQFQCVPNSTISSWVWWVVGAAIVLLLLIIIGGIIWAYSSSSSEQPKVAVEKADPVQTVFTDAPADSAPVMLTAPAPVYASPPPPAYYQAPPPPYPYPPVYQQPLYTADGRRVS